MVRKKENDNSYFNFPKDKNYDNFTLAEALNVEDYKKKVILILGGPGMGKSTLAINICKQWAGGNLLQGYDAVLLLLLRDPEVQEAKDLLLALNDEIRENIYKEITYSNGEKICFILEGYDELPYKLRQSSVFTKLMEKLPKCTIMYTSRPDIYPIHYVGIVNALKLKVLIPNQLINIFQKHLKN